uniref:J domain-containing protein n=1 Tax=Leptocylindrus danicus TaxID=163516 RepID=A0A7S2L5V5_9STRA|mmetsp:Transcript_31594/g.46016  ORF Transcript_31594/g.46016 Transcript_31594/m.46016 type:complete len:237 (+) Transcript_31594:116-826(+)
MSSACRKCPILFLCFLFLIACTVSKGEDVDDIGRGAFDKSSSASYDDSGLTAEQLREAAEFEKLQAQREAEYEAKLEKMDKEQRKKLEKQRKIDARLVNKVLKAASKGDHYRVLGLSNNEKKIGSFVLFRVTPAHIKKAFRERARKLHPDKNTDPRATQAFIELEESASVLADADSKEEYDETVAMQKQRSRDDQRQMIFAIHRKAVSFVRPIFVIFNTAVRPFATSLTVMGVLIL